MYLIITTVYNKFQIQIITISFLDHILTLYEVTVNRFRNKDNKEKFLKSIVKIGMTVSTNLYGCNQLQFLVLVKLFSDLNRFSIRSGDKMTSANRG